MSSETPDDSSREPLTYASAGVDITAGEDAVRRIKRAVQVFTEPQVASLRLIKIGKAPDDPVIIRLLRKECLAHSTGVRIGAKRFIRTLGVSIDIANAAINIEDLSTNVESFGPFASHVLE